MSRCRHLICFIRPTNSIQQVTRVTLANTTQVTQRARASNPVISLKNLNISRNALDNLQRLYHYCQTGLDSSVSYHF